LKLHPLTVLQSTGFALQVVSGPLGGPTGCHVGAGWENAKVAQAAATAKDETTSEVRRVALNDIEPPPIWLEPPQRNLQWVGVKS